MNVEELRALFAGETATRLKTIVDRLDTIDAEMEKLAQERSDLDAELREILGEIGQSKQHTSQAGARAMPGYLECV
jgi:phage shock protein A